MSNYGWQNRLFEGLTVDTGKPVPVSTGSITKAIVHQQIPEHTIPSFEVITDNYRNRAVNARVTKQKFSARRSMNFMPQE